MITSKANVYDVAAYILEQKGSIPAIKLQKLVYYSQAWSLVWDENPLFEEPIEAWRYGPVIPKLYESHKGQYKVDNIPEGDPQKLTPEQKETIDAVLEFYGEKSSQWLSDLTHQEEPWIKARKGLSPSDAGDQEITQESMAEYYHSIYNG